MIPSDPASDPGAPETPLRGLTAASIEALRTRLDLAAVELEIHVLLLLRMLAWIAAALACLLLALAFGATALIVALWNTHRMLGLLGGSAAFILLGVLLVWLGLRSVRNRPGLLAGSLEELREDQRQVSNGP